MPGNGIYGYRPPKPKPVQSLARAASNPTAGASSYYDPYGLNRGSGSASLQGFGSPGPPSQPAGVIHQAALQAPVATPPLYSSAQAAQAAQQAQAQAPTLPTYDLNTDPALQQVQALAGQSDEQAKAAALKQKQQLLLDYGDQSLAQAILGANDPTAAAAGASPTSTLASLKQQRDRGLAQMTDQLNKANLFYSGARVKDESQAGQDYQNALAQAASAVNASLQGIDSQLAAALNQNAMQRAQALQQAFNNAVSAAVTQSSGAPPPPPPSQDPTQPPPASGIDVPLIQYLFGPARTGLIAS